MEAPLLDYLVDFFLWIFTGFIVAYAMVYVISIFRKQMQKLGGDPPVEAWPKRLTLAGIAILGFLALGGLTLLFLFAARLYVVTELTNDTESFNWPTTTGLITSSKIESWTESGDTDFASSVEYEYVVDNRKYSSNRIRFGGFLLALPGNKAEAEEALRLYASGNSVQVYFDPDEPSLSVLEPGAGRIRILLMLAIWVIMSIFSCLLAGSCALAAIRRLR